MARSASALRSEASAIAQRCLDILAAASPGARIRRSVSSVTAIRNSAPATVIQPSTGCRMKTKAT